MENFVPRRMKSLNLLTTKFIHLLENSDNGELDLGEVIKILGISSKRRLYDITGVLEGIGVIMKKSKRVVKLVGSLPKRPAQRSSGRLELLESEVGDLKLMELALDQQITWVRQSIASIKEDRSDYVNHEDIFNYFNGHTVLAVQAPPGTQLDVPIPKAVQNSPPTYQVHLKSVNGPIDVVFMSKACVGSVPVILPIPPPEEILQTAKSAMLASEEKDGISGTSPTSASATQRCQSEQMATTDTHKSPFRSPEPNRTAQSAFHELTKELQNRLDEPKDLLTRFIATEVFPPLLHLSSSPPEQYARNLEQSEGVSNPFDVPALSV